MTTLETGAGLCCPTHQLSIRPVPAVIKLGALPDLIHTALNAAHHVNRQGAPNDRVAVALPGMHLHRGVARPGTEVVLFGSQAALERYLLLDGIRRLASRGMLRDFEVVESMCQPGERGTAYVRDRQAAKRSPGAVRRARARAERRGISMPDTIETRQVTRAILALHFGSAVVHVREIEAEITNGPLSIGTYGFSSISAPAVLPILSDRSTRSLHDAA
ncbi:MAG: hypothetical protein AB7I42_29355 [Bradyrhizobium sp.]|uniref:hypothetical protein n=1 Tax=Bradyrhizobium sp. TaxID=376 RepID=UPI003D0C2099